MRHAAGGSDASAEFGDRLPAAASKRGESPPWRASRGNRGPPKESQAKATEQTQFLPTQTESTAQQTWRGPPVGGAGVPSASSPSHPAGLHPPPPQPPAVRGTPVTVLQIRHDAPKSPRPPFPARRSPAIRVHPRFKFFLHFPEPANPRSQNFKIYFPRIINGLRAVGGNTLAACMLYLGSKQARRSAPVRNGVFVAPRRLRTHNPSLEASVGRVDVTVFGIVTWLVAR